MLRNTTTLIALSIAAAAIQDTRATPTPQPLYSNYQTANLSDAGIATGLTTTSGVAAPAGARWSEPQSDAEGAAAIAGFANHAAQGGGAYRFADDFTISGSAFGWNISKIAFYAYQTGATSTAPVSAITLRVWRGRPGDAGSTVVWGDTVTNRLSTTFASNIYRVFNSVAQPDVQPPSTQRRVWENAVSTPGLTLPPGTYWLDWQQAAANGAAVFVPPVTYVNARGKPGANARQLRRISGVDTWQDLVDPGKPSTAPDVPQDLPFIIIATAAPSGCPGDADLDRVVGFADITSVLVNIGTSYRPGTGPGDGDGDGDVTFSDITSSLVNFGVTCP